MMSNLWKKALSATMAATMLMATPVLAASTESVFDDQETFPGMLVTETERSGLEAATKQITDRTLKVGFCPSAVDVYYNRIWYGIEDTLVQTGYNIEFDYQAPSSQTATDEAVTIIEGWIAQEYDAIVLTISDEASLTSVIKEATESGIPVFLMNSPEFENEHYVSNIGYDQSLGGYLLGKYVGEYYKDAEEANLCFVIGVAGDVFTRKRMEGFNEAIAEYDNINILDTQEGRWSRADAATVAEDMLQAYPDMDGFVTLFDDMGLGIYQVVKANGLEDDIKIFGYDNMSNVYDLIADGTTYVNTVDTCTYVSGKNIVNAVHKYCVEGEIVPKTIFMEPVTYDASNIGEFDYLQFGEGPKGE